MNSAFFSRSSTLTQKLLLPLVILNLVTTAAFTGFLYIQQKNAVIAGIDRQLSTSAQGVRMLVDPFHDRLDAPGSLTQAEADSLNDRLSEYAEKAGLKYLYTMVQRDGKIVFTLSSYTREEKEKGETTQLFDPYDDASEGLETTFASFTGRFDEYTDKWGSFRSVFLTCRSPKGTPYVIGADISLDEVGAATRKTLFGCLAIGVVVFAAGTALTRLVVRSIPAAVGILAERVNQIADGDLTVTIDYESDDELGMLAADMNRMAQTLRGLVNEVRLSAESVTAEARVLATTAGAIAAGAESATAKVLGVSSAGEEMAATSLEIASNCGTVTESARGATVAATAGTAVAEATVGVMGRIAGRVRKSSHTVEGLGARSKQIGKIAGTIKDIADQTNLLALNAAIEAAGAGEYGRGFAVVADEVRALASRTTKATKEISEMIWAIQKETTDAVASMEEGVAEVERGTVEAGRSGEALQNILKKISDVEKQISQIAGAADQQTLTTNEISRNMHRITNVVQDTSRGAQETAAAAAQLLLHAEELKRMVGRFRLTG